MQRNIRVVIKSLLKLKKLNLVKNRHIRNCEEQIQGIFNQLQAENEEDKKNFVKECLTLVESGECDLKESRFLFEDICKLINPVKPQQEYFLHLQKARSNEEFLPGKMSKNPYSSKSFGGKTMADVRAKICRDCDIIEPEMLELVIANKIIAMTLPITAVYEQVWWPHVYKKENPDSYEVPPIEEADASLSHMHVIFRLAGMDGEATEDRIETLNDSNELTNERDIEKKFGLAKVISEPLGQLTGVEVLLNTLESIEHVQEYKDLASWLVQLISLAIKLKVNREQFLKSPRAIAIIAKKLFQSVGMHNKFDGKNEQSLFDFILSILEILINEQIASGSKLVSNDSLAADDMQEDQVD